MKMEFDMLKAEVDVLKQTVEGLTTNVATHKTQVAFLTSKFALKSQVAGLTGKFAIKDQIKEQLTRLNNKLDHKLDQQKNLFMRKALLPVHDESTGDFHTELKRLSEKAEGQISALDDLKSSLASHTEQDEEDKKKLNGDLGELERQFTEFVLRISTLEQRIRAMH